MRLKFLTALLIFLPVLLGAQDMKLYAPFPSRINAETSGSNIIITWKDSSDVKGGIYEIYRAETALTADNLNQAQKIGETPSGVQTFSDAAPEETDFYYAVFVRDDKQVYKICIPYRNVTTSPVSVKKSDIEETKSSVITSLTGKVAGENIYISYTSSLKDRNVILFRSTSPISSYDNLIKSVVVNEEAGSLSSFTDNPLPGLDYYYAAVDAALYRSGSKNLLYAGNHTVTPLHTLFSHEATDKSRYAKSPMPLPLLDISEDLKSGVKLDVSEAPQRKDQISSETLADVKKMIGNEKPDYKLPGKATLAYNKNINSIISNEFAASKWKICAEKLEPFTGSRYDEDTRMESHFYLGQSYFYLGEYNKALLEFIMVEKRYYMETKPFFDAIYSIKRSS